MGTVFSLLARAELADELAERRRVNQQNYNGKLWRTGKSILRTHLNDLTLSSFSIAVMPLGFLMLTAIFDVSIAVSITK